MATNYIILPIVQGKRGNRLVPGTPQRVKDGSKALAAAERMASIVVLEEHSDPEEGIHGAPSLLRAIGDVPAEMIEALVA